MPIGEPTENHATIRIARGATNRHTARTPAELHIAQWPRGIVTPHEFWFVVSVLIFAYSVDSLLFCCAYSHFCVYLRETRTRCLDEFWEVGKSGPLGGYPGELPSFTPSPGGRVASVTCTPAREGPEQGLPARMYNEGMAIGLIGLPRDGGKGATGILTPSPSGWGGGGGITPRVSPRVPPSLPTRGGGGGGPIR